jgi:hypothetical protein
MRFEAARDGSIGSRKLRMGFAEKLRLPIAVIAYRPSRHRRGLRRSPHVQGNLGVCFAARRETLMGLSSSPVPGLRCCGLSEASLSRTALRARAAVGFCPPFTLSADS